jgi:Uncharacterized protein conserved in bacteria
MFEMKNEMEDTATKHRNEEFFKKLDRDRTEKGCEYGRAGQPFGERQRVLQRRNRRCVTSLREDVCNPTPVFHSPYLSVAECCQSVFEIPGRSWQR